MGKNGRENKEWHLSRIYGNLEQQHKHKTWKIVREIEPPRNLPWICVGDFNEIIWTTEKKGGNMRFTNNMGKYRQPKMDLDLLDLGFKGFKFTWTNGRSG